MDKKILAGIDVIIEQCQFELVNGKLPKATTLVIPYSRFLKSNVIADKAEVFRVIKYTCIEILSIEPPDLLKEAVESLGSWILYLSPVNFEILINYQKSEKIKVGKSKHNSNLLESIPGGGKYKVPRKIAELFQSKDEIDNFYLAKCLKIKLQQNNKTVVLTKTRYKANKEKYDRQIKNCLRTIRKKWKPLGYSIQYRKEKSKVVQVN